MKEQEGLKYQIEGEPIAIQKEQVKRYIQEQEGKDVFEYDIYNCPEKLKGQLRIGDFTNG